MEYAIHSLRACALFLLVLMLSACAPTPRVAQENPSQKMDQAEFGAYEIQIIASDANQVICDYGPYRLANYPVIPLGESSGRSSMTGFREVFREMKCTWTALDGSRQKEVIDMPKLPKNNHVEWEHVEGERVLKEELIRNNHPYLYFEIQDKRMSVFSAFAVQRYGQTFDDNSWGGVLSRDVRRIVYERKL